MERKGGTALCRQAGCLGSRMAFSPSISPLAMAGIKLGAMAC